MHILYRKRIFIIYFGLRVEGTLAGCDFSSPSRAELQPRRMRGLALGGAAGLAPRAVGITFNVLKISIVDVAEVKEVVVCAIGQALKGVPLPPSTLHPLTPHTPLPLPIPSPSPIPMHPTPGSLPPSPTLDHCTQHARSSRASASVT